MRHFILIFWISVFATSNFSKECCAGQQSPQQATPSAPQASAQDTLLNLTKITSKSIGTFVIAYMLAPIAKKYIKKAITQAGFDKVKAAFNSITQAVAEHSKSNSTSTLSATSGSPEKLVPNQDLENAWVEATQTGDSHGSRTVTPASEKVLENAWVEATQTGDSHGKSISHERIFDVGGTHDTSSQVTDATFETVWEKKEPTDIKDLEDPSKKTESLTDEKKLSTPPSESSPHTSESIHGSSHASTHTPPPTTGRTPTTPPLTTLGQTSTAHSGRRAKSLLLTSSDQKQVETWATEFSQSTANPNNESSPQSETLSTTPTEKSLQESSKTQKVQKKPKKSFQELQKAWQESQSSKRAPSSTVATSQQQSEINSKSSNPSMPSKDQSKQWPKEYKEYLKQKAQLAETKKAQARLQRFAHQPNPPSADSQQWTKEFSSKEGDEVRLERLIHEESNHSTDGKIKLTRGESLPAFSKTKTAIKAKL